MTDILSVQEVAARLGVSPERVRWLIAAGRIKATRLGRDWAIREADLLAYSRRPVGRPPRPSAS